ncbi:hypothetical protein CEXT_248931 [Caerostris extrusa]|uniref:Uncharacterized protein n=1 Tax=Caerostris extrusa TaxID=172846 RepID=A0AAV4UQQ3_CAEEX|nr:hypothetical protein CEXT_248931 [Caerostris extrusa]
MLCIKEFVDKCGTLNADLFRDLVLADKIENVIEVTKVLCKKDSETYRVVVKHLPCIREVTDEFNYCSLKRNNTIKLLQEHLGSREMMPFQHVTRCLPTVLNSNCYVGRFDKKCGSDLKDVALAAIDKMDMLTFDCPKTLHPEFLILLELVEKLTKEKIYVKSTFQ